MKKETPESMYRKSSGKVMVLAIVTLLLSQIPVDASWGQERKNVLFIAVDDLRPELGCYDKNYMHTPSFDKLAQRGVLFENAFCMVPTCGASRAAVMSSRRPAPDRFINYLTWASKDAPEAIPLHTQFKKSGYTTISLGKIFHHVKDHVDGWSDDPIRGHSIQYFNQQEQRDSIAAYKTKYPQSKKEVRGPATESADVDDSLYGDGMTADEAIKRLDEFSKDPTQPFFMAVGFYKPHLPFTAPKKYFDLYDRDEIKLPSNNVAPKNVPRNALHTSGELRAYSDIPPNGPVTDEKARELIHGYRACVSFIDAQLGRVLKKLDETGLAENTIVVLWSDHGWQLGEHGLWNKHSCFETSMWTPLLVAVPGDKSIKPASRVPGIVELIDLYPSICELANVEIPIHVEGESFVPLLRDPKLAGKPYAIGRYRFGDTIRTEDFRYTEFRGKRGGRSGDGPVGAGSLIGKMLFNHASDPNETENVVDQATFSETVKEMSANLNADKGRLKAAEKSTRNSEQ